MQVKELFLGIKKNPETKDIHPVTDEIWPVFTKQTKAKQKENG